MSEDNAPINCEQAIKMLFEYMDKELDPNNHNAMEKHIHACRSCFSRYEFEKRLKGMVGDATSNQTSEKFKSRISKIINDF